MEIKSIPSNYDDLIDILNREGSIYFLIDRRHKKRFRKCIQRLNNLETLIQNNSKFIATLYAVYVGLLQICLTFGHKNLDNAVTVYQVAWRHIGSFKGEDYSGNLSKVTFNARS
jgi:hypothetical protein